MAVKRLVAYAEFLAEDPVMVLGFPMAAWANRTLAADLEGGTALPSPSPGRRKPSLGAF